MVCRECCTPARPLVPWIGCHVWVLRSCAVGVLVGAGLAQLIGRIV